MLNDYGKLWLIALSMTLSSVCGTLLVILGDDAIKQAGVVLLTAGITGPSSYLFGNGKLAARGEAPSPVYTPTPEKIVEHEVQTIVRQELDHIAERETPP